MKLRHLVFTLLAATLLGAAAAWIILPRFFTNQALKLVASKDDEDRDRAWARLMPILESADDDEIERMLALMNEELAYSRDDAILQAGNRLRSIDRWGWDHQYWQIISRDVSLQAARREEIDQQLAIDHLRFCPQSVPEKQVIFLHRIPLRSGHASIRMAALATACAWFGLDRLDRLTQLELPPDDPDLRRRLLLALSWSPPPDFDPSPDREHDPGVFEAKLLVMARSEFTDVETLSAMAASEDDATNSLLPYLLSRSPAPEAMSLLDRLADDGDANARFARQAVQSDLDAKAAKTIAIDEAELPWRRRLAAWRWDDIDERRLRDILALDPAEPDGSVFTTALLAERRLDRPAAQELAGQWLLEFNDDRKRAGALLAALLGAHGDRIEEALDTEDQVAVRTAYRLALTAMGRGVGPEDAVEFAHRTLHKPDGDFDADSAVCLLQRGHGPTLELLTSQPRGDWRLAVQQRAWLIERFVPQWHELAGRPVGGGIRAVRLHFDALEMLRQLTQRRVEFDPQRGNFAWSAPTP